MFEVELTTASTPGTQVTRHESQEDAILRAAQACIDAPNHARARIWHKTDGERTFVDTVYGNGTGQAYADAWRA